MFALASAELFRLLSPEEIASLTHRIQERAFSVGQEIFREGDPGDGLYVVSEGLVEISGNLSGGQRQVFSQIAPGGVFGEMSVIEQLPRSACATAKSPTRVLFISRAEMQTAIERSPVLASALLQLVSRRLREFNQQYLREVLEAERLAAVGRFARSIVHDLKNPLNIIGLTAELVSKQNATAEFRANAKSRILRQVEHINVLITDILQFTRGESKLDVAPTNYARFVEEIVAELQPDLKMKSVTLAVPAPAPEIVLNLDKKLLRRVFANLAYNAVDVLPGEGRIEFRFSTEPGYVRTEIRDNGPGIASEIASRLFQPFATHGKEHGSGLGLSICKKIVEDHGGKISAQNDPAGGAVFAFTLPVANRD
jgi:signal transduction histidine kinase